MGYAYGLWGRCGSIHWRYFGSDLFVAPGIGGVFAPLVCQTIIASGAPWQNFYYGSLVVAGVNLALVMYAFQPTQRELFTERKEALSNASPRSAPGTPKADDSQKMAFSPSDSNVNTSPLFPQAPAKPENSQSSPISSSYGCAKLTP